MIPKHAAVPDAPTLVRIDDPGIDLESACVGARDLHTGTSRDVEVACTRTVAVNDKEILTASRAADADTLAALSLSIH